MKLFVQAVSWCPWQRNILASGGGTVDRHIRIWNGATGTCLNSHDTMDQVSNIRLCQLLIFLQLYLRERL